MRKCSRVAAFAQGLQRTRLGRGPQRRDRVPLGARRCRSPVATARRNWFGRRAGCHLRYWQPHAAAAAAGDPRPFRSFSSTCVDPVGSRLRRKPGAPGGNVTGFTHLRVELERQVAGAAQARCSRASRALRVLVNPANTRVPVGQLSAIQAAAPSLGVELTPVDVRDRPRDRARHRGTCARAEWRPDRDGEPVAQRSSRSIIALAARHRLPAIYAFRDFVAAGGLMSYGPDIADQYPPRRPAMSTASSRARSRPTCRCSSRPSSSWSSISRPPRRSASTCRRRCSPAPTR